MHLVDDVLPHVPLRQWILALPFDLHLRAARDARVQSALLNLLVEELGEVLHGVTKTGAEARSGSVTFVQLFGSSLNLHVHFHVLALDGVYVPDGENKPPKFVRAPTPTRDQLRWLVERVAVRARQMLSRKPAPEPAEELQQPALKLLDSGVCNCKTRGIKGDSGPPDAPVPAGGGRQESHWRARLAARRAARASRRVAASSSGTLVPVPK